MNNSVRSFNILQPGPFNNDYMSETPMIILRCTLYYILLAYNSFSIKKNVSTICEKDSVCLWTYTKKIFSLETNSVSDQNNMRRQMNEEQKMFSFGYVVLNVKALSFCFLYTIIKREQTLQGLAIKQNSKQEREKSVRKCKISRTHAYMLLTLIRSQQLHWSTINEAIQ